MMKTNMFFKQCQSSGEEEDSERVYIVQDASD